MDNNTHIEELVSKVFSGHITPEELVELRQWLSVSEDNRKLYDSYMDCWVTSKASFGKNDYYVDSAWENFKRRSVNNPDKNRFSTGYFLRIAAVFLIALGAGIVLNISVRDNAADSLLSEVIHASSNDSVLKIVLPDQSQVWLNRGSVLRYPSDFNFNNRNIYLEGEGYFDITENRSLPFTVHTPLVQVKVLGTSFNINAYKEKSEIVTTLITGKLDIEVDGSFSTILYPDQQLVFQKESKKIELFTVNTEFCISWINGYYKFEKEPFGQIAIQLEKMYHVKINFADQSLKSIPFTGTFLLDQSIETSLEILKTTWHFRYTIKGDQITISK